MQTPSHGILAALSSLVFKRPRRRALPSAEVRALPAPPGPQDQLRITVNEFGPEERHSDIARSRGRFLVRQDRWADLADEIRAAERSCATTPAGAPIADLLAYGARSDVVDAVEHALEDGACRDERILLDGVMGFEAALREHGHDPMIALIVALTHIDIAWAWRGQDWPTAASERNQKRAAAHFDRASKILAPHCGLDLNSPALLAACCALHAGQPSHTTHIADRYETLIDMAPDNPRHMRALGNHMLPCWFGSYADLELEARRTASRTQLLWGAGGYTWVYFDAISNDAEACAHVDVAFFLDGLRDIVRVRPDQDMVNLLTAFCAITMAHRNGVEDEAEFNRSQISAAADWLIRDHLTEIRPLIWAHAANGFANNLHVSSARQFASRGRTEAFQVLSDLFRDEISRGFRVTFTPDGLQLDAG